MGEKRLIVKNNSGLYLITLLNVDMDMDKVTALVEVYNIAEKTNEHILLHEGERAYNSTLKGFDMRLDSVFVGIDDSTIARITFYLVDDMNLTTLGTLTFKSTPSGASVYLNGDYKGTTPLTLSLLPGNYSVRFSKNGYYDYTTKVAISAGEKKTITAVLTPEFGYLKITTEPPGANVYINDEYIGRTPISHYKLSTGAHTVILRMKNYESYVTNVTIHPGEETNLAITLTPLPSHLIINSVPSGSEVYVNGTYRGKTPLHLTIKPGTYNLRVSKEDHGEYTTTFMLQPNETKTLNITLTPNYAHLTIKSDPPGASIYINETYKGKTPLTVDLMMGTYSIKLSKEGYQDYTLKVTLSPGESKTLSPSLTPAYGFLSVTSEPAGADVYIDGNYVGTTPLTNYKLSPGEHEVKIKKDGYKEYTKTVTITAGEKKTLSTSLVLLLPPTSSTTTASGITTTSTTTTTTTTTPPAFTSETPAPAQTSGGSNFNPIYIAGALIGLLLVGGVMAKARGGKSREKPKPEPAPIEDKRPEELAVPARKHAHQEIPVPGFPPELLDKYEPLEFLGEGGFAKVFKARRKKDGKIVALKIPRIDERTSKTFLKEITAWLQLDHPNIVRLYDVDILPVPYLEMEFVEGVNVDGKTVRDLGGYPKPVDEKTALKLIKGIAEGLKHAHSKGIYHRDLKPLNILLKSDLTPKITDWGLAKLGTMSSGRSVLGYTPLYASPEHLMPGKYGHTDWRTDIWQLGVTFYELLTGKLPFEGYTYEEVFGKITDESYRFTPPSKINPALAKYDGIFEKLLAKRKEERYQSVEEFLKDLEKLDEVEKKRAELEKEVEELKKTLSKSVQALKRSTTVEETLRNRRLVVETLGRLALAYAELNRKAELLNTLNDLKFYTVQNLVDLTNAINTVELLIKENLPVSDDFIERLKVLIHNIKRENGA
ncbi:PEGA domain-containing protein [Thermococcus gammatolerans]|uniref:PEGA domain-containing protein n=1 Tax=Thermococcus gammatolerans TaxID=187878 RepID=UPI00145E7128|nr:PEGA domain-containing protein [Thermococcus gammatolerans]